MRADMSKVITERPRYDPGETYGNRAHKGHAIEDLPAKESMTKRHRMAHNSKEFTDVLGPLKRYFEKQLGRPWDKVFAEVCATIDSRKVTGRHVLEHVEQFVASNCEAVPESESSTGFVNNTTMGNYCRRLTVDEGDLMVDPITGLIKRAKRLTRRAEFKIDPVTKLLGPNNIAVKHKGVWYDVNFVPYKKIAITKTYATMGADGLPRTYETTAYEVEGRVVDRLNDCCIGFLDLKFWETMGSRRRGDDRRLVEIYNRKNVYGKSKKTMSSTELRRHNLKND